MTIKHLVFSGSGLFCLSYLGSVQTLTKKNYIDMEEIESIYGLSSGALTGFLLCLKHNLKKICNYCVNDCMYEEIFSISIKKICNIYKKKGLFNIDTFKLFFKPLMEQANIPIDINFKDLYNHSKIALHTFTLDVNTKKTIEMSHITHPELSVINAVYMSSTLPIIFSPIIENNKCYIDLGLMYNNPIKKCVDSGCNPEEIILFNTNHKSFFFDENTTIVNFMPKILQYLIFERMNNDENYKNTKIIYDYTFFDNDAIVSWVDFVKNKLSRKKLYKYGVKQAKKLIKDNLQNTM